MHLLLLKILVHTTRIFGLLPMRIEFAPLHAAPSQLAYLQSLAYLFVFGPVTIVCMGIYLWITFFSQKAEAATSTFMFTVSLAWSIGVVRSLCMYTVQMYRRNSLVTLFNEALRIRVMFEASYGALYADAPFLDRKCKQLVRWKICSLVLQFGFIVFAMNYDEMESYGSIAVGVLVKLSILIGTDVVMLVYSAGHFAVTLVALQFFRSVNARLTECVAVVRELLLTRRQSDVKVHLHSNITEDIDRIAFLYDQVSAYTHRLNVVFGFPVVMTLMNSFLYTLVAVSWVTICKTSVLHNTIAVISSSTIWCMMLVNWLISRMTTSRRRLCTIAFSLRISRCKSILWYGFRMRSSRRPTRPDVFCAEPHRFRSISQLKNA